MKTTLLAFMEATAKAASGNEDRQLRMEVTLMTVDGDRMKFGYGFHDLREVVYYPAGKDEFEMLPFEEAVERFMASLVFVDSKGEN